MYIIKNALRCIGRAKGRNVLIGIIALVIAISACIGLSIRQAAESAKESTLSELSITATISYDRSSMMNDMMGGMSPGNGEDKHYGLGLAIAKAIATSHKGDIAVKSYDGFVEFTVQIPAL